MAGGADRVAHAGAARSHYYRRGPEGVGLGAIQIVRHDGRGGLTIEDRPFVLQVDDGMIDVGIVAR